MISILFEDNHLLVVTKPPGMLTQGDRTADEDMVNWLKNDLKKRYQKPGNVFLGLVHRLDRPVGGTMVFAKTSKAASRLSEYVRNRTFKKTYLAIIKGVPECAENTLINYLAKNEQKNVVTCFNEPTENAKYAELSYRVLENKAHYSLVSVDLKTGRPHQIRVQFSNIGHPLIGDAKYGTPSKHSLSLWSHTLSFPHPISKEWMTFTSNPPLHAIWSDWNTFD